MGRPAAPRCSKNAVGVDGTAPNLHLGGQRPPRQMAAHHSRPPHLHSGNAPLGRRQMLRGGQRRNWKRHDGQRQQAQPWLHMSQCCLPQRRRLLGLPLWTGGQRLGQLLSARAVQHLKAAVLPAGQCQADMLLRGEAVLQAEGVAAPAPQHSHSVGVVLCLMSRADLCLTRAVCLPLMQECSPESCRWAVIALLRTSCARSSGRGHPMYSVSFAHLGASLKSPCKHRCPGACPASALFWIGVGSKAIAHVARMHLSQDA